MEQCRITHKKNPKTFIDYFQTIDDAYETLEDYNAMKNKEVLIVFDDIIGNKELQKKKTNRNKTKENRIIVSELFR